MRRILVPVLLLTLLLAASAPAADLPKVGDTWREPATGMEFVWVPGGALQAPVPGPSPATPTMATTRTGCRAWPGSGWAASR